MNNVHETLHPDSEIWAHIVADEVIEKTESELWEVLEEKENDISSDFVIDEVKRLNPDATIETDPDRWFIFSSVDIEKLVLPEWFYCNQKNGITNKHNTKSGIYVSIHVYPLSHYDPDYI
jgi:hypothetical protein